MYILLLLSCATAKKTEVETVTSPPSIDVEVSQPEEQTTRDPPPRLPPESGQISTPSHCTAEEQVVFSCATIAQSNRGTKIVSLCGELRGEPSDWIQYRFGALGQVEFVFPAEKNQGFQAFSYWEERSARSLGYVLEFDQAEAYYQLTSKIGGSAQGEAEYNNFRGVSGYVDGQDFQIPCGEYSYDADNLDVLMYWFGMDDGP